MHFLSSRGLKIWVGIALLKKKEMYSNFDFSNYRVIEWY